MAQRPSSASISSTASGLAQWCRKTLFGSKELSGEENEPLRSVALTENEVELGAIEECPICTTASKSKLCAAVPCKHEACERCWMSWQKQAHKTCMICAQPIKSVNYHASGRLSKNKGSHFAKAADEALEDTLRAMLRIKNELFDINEKVEETQSHLAFLLQNAQAGVFDSDSATSIVQVEISTTRDQLEKLQKTTTHLPDVDKALAVLNRSLKDVDAVANSYGDLSDWSRTTLMTFTDVITPGHKEKRSALALQWKTVTDQYSDLLTNKLNVVQAMAMVMPMEGLGLISMLEKAKVSIVSGLPPINEKVQAFEYDARRFVEKVHVASTQLPTLEHQFAAGLAISAKAPSSLD